MKTDDRAENARKETYMNIKSSILNSILAAFASYSRIPVPAADWDENKTRWQICFFPLVGAVIGIFWCVAAAGLTAIGTEPVLTGAVLTILPVFLTGGIHMDGFLDTSDAMHSWRSSEEQMRILDDPHIGAFAFIYGSFYLILYFGFSVQLAQILREIFLGNAAFAGLLGRSAGTLVPVASCFIISRALSALAVIYFPKSRKNGSLKKAADAADPKAGTVVKVTLAVLFAVFIFSSVLFKMPALPLLPAAAVLFMYRYRSMAMKRFGGISGDLAGWFLVNSELIMLAVGVILLMLRFTAV